VIVKSSQKRFPIHQRRWRKRKESTGLTLVAETLTRTSLSVGLGRFNILKFEHIRPTM
jgi:hypothetical protein